MTANFIKHTHNFSNSLSRMRMDNNMSKVLIRQENIDVSVTIR